MLGLFRQNAFAGDTPGEAFLVQCDSTTTTPEDVAKVARSYTGQYLKPLLKGRAPEKLAPAKRMRAAE